MTVLASRAPPTKLSIARYASISSKEVSSFLMSVLSESKIVAQLLAQMGVDIKALFASASLGVGSGSSSSNGGGMLATVICPIIKNRHNQLLAASQSAG